MTERDIATYDGKRAPTSTNKMASISVSLQSNRTYDMTAVNITNITILKLKFHNIQMYALAMFFQNTPT